MGNGVEWGVLGGVKGKGVERNGDVNETKGARAFYQEEQAQREVCLSKPHHHDSAQQSLSISE